MKPVLVVLSLVLVLAAAALLFVDGEDPTVSGPGPSVAADAAPVEAGALAPPSLESGAGETALAAAPVRETVVLTEDGDVADLPPDALLTSSLSVKVEDAFGRPIVDAEVLLRAGFPGRREVPVPFVDFAAEAVADARGVATFAVPPIGVYTARASSPGFAEDELGPIVPGDEVTLRLDAGETLSGVVTDASTEAPLEGAVVRLERGSADFEAETDAEGAFSVVDLAPGGYTLRAFAPGYDVRVDTDVQVPAEAGELALSLAPGVRVTGVVVEDGTDAPVNGARVEVEGGGRLSSLPLPEPALTDAEGRFAFEPPLSRRGLRLVVTAPGFAAERHSVNAKEGAAEVEARIVVLRGVTVSGRVTAPDGSAVASASVGLRATSSRARLETDADAEGRYEFQGVRPGDQVEIDARDPAGTYAPTRLEPRALEEDAQGVEIDVTIALGARLDGEVVDGTGARVAQARVLVEGLDAEVWKQLRQKPVLFTDSDGRFALTGLPEALLTVSAEHQGFVAPETPIALAVGGVHATTLALGQGALLEGFVVDSRGAPVDDALVTAHAVRDGFVPPSVEVLHAASRGGDREGRGRGRNARGGGRVPAERILHAATGGREEQLTAFRALARTDAAGRFVLRGLQDAEPLALAVRKSGHEARHEFGVQPGGRPVRIVLPALAALSGRVVDATTRSPLTAFRVRAEPVLDQADETLGDVLAKPSRRQRSFRADDGTFELAGLQSGVWMVSVSSPLHRWSEPVRVEVAPALTGDVLLEAVPASAVEVRVEAAGGAGVAGLSVTLRPRDGGGRALRRTTGKDGRVTFFDPKAGEYELVVGSSRDPFLGPVPVTVREAERVTRTLSTERLGAVVVEVRAGNGFGIDRARVLVRGLQSGVRRTARTDARGRVRLDGLPPEEVRVTAKAKGHGTLDQTVAVHGGGTAEVTLHLPEQP